MRRTQRVLLVAALAAAVALAGCTGGEGEVVIDGTGDPEADLAAAVEATLSGTGRFEQVDVLEFVDLPESDSAGDSDSSGDDVFTMRSSGAFDGPNLTATLLPGEDGATATEVLLVDGRAYVGLGEVDELSEEFVPGALEEMRALIGDARWIELTEPDADDGGSSMSWFIGVAVDPAATDPLVRITEMLESPDSVLDDGTEVLDGVEHRRVLAALPVEGFLGAAGGEQDPDIPELPESEERLQRVLDAAAQHQRVEVTVLISPDGLLRRLEVVLSSDVPEQYRDCMWFLTGIDGTSTVDFFDLGSDVSIEGPPADEVLDGENARALEDLWAEAWVGPAFDESGTGDGEEWSEQWTEADREYLEDELRTYADVIGLDPATISSMSIEEMGEASDRIWDAMDDLPTTETTLGALTRPELLDMVKMGMEWLDIDPATADTMTDEQLGTAIDAYLAENSRGLPGFADGGFVDDEMLEGCPD